ncbi:MAG: hypothetical protein ACK515_18965 [bacterium]|jgi:hypothetical protein|nr:hypothetical protein [Betaproteobacteria bacterium]
MERRSKASQPIAVQPAVQPAAQPAAAARAALSAVPTAVPTATLARRRHARAPGRALATLAAAVITCGLAGGAMAQATQAPMKGEPGERSQARANAAKSPAGAPKGDWTRHFTPEERDAWQQKIAAAADEQERRKLRGQRLAEIQRRTKAQRAETAGSAAPPAARAARPASPPEAGAAQRPR